MDQEWEIRPGLGVLMEFPQLVKSLQNIDGRLFATLEDGTVIDCTDLLGEAKH
jgi:hypothetical protein